MNTTRIPRDPSTLQVAILAAAIIIGGAAIGLGFARGRSADRYVTVKGVAERDVQADLAIWPLHLVAADNDLSRAQGKIQADLVKVRGFLARSGLDTAGITLQGFSVADAQTNQYGGANQGARFVIKQTAIVRSSNVNAVLLASQRVGELVSQGVVLSSGQEYGAGGPTFVFTGLNALKPPMIAEATARAREAAEQFARDSQSGLDGIRQANQGIFEILPRDAAQGITEESQVTKRVRVVSTVEYSLSR